MVGRAAPLAENFSFAMTPRPSSSAGLCQHCRHARAVPTPRSEFLLCERSKTDPAFERYPRLPVRSCPGFERGAQDEAPAGEAPDRGNEGETG